MEKAPRHIFLTGATSGIGLAIALALHNAKAGKLTLFGRNREKLDDLQNTLQANAVPIDLADAIGRQTVFKEAMQTHGHPDVLINCAGFGVYRKLIKTEDELHRQIMEVNYFAPAQLMQCALPAMLEKRAGHMINIASVAATFGPFGHGPYAAAKAGLISLTQSLSVEHRHSGVQFSYIKPGLVKTGFFANPGYEQIQKQVDQRGIEPMRVAKVVLKLLRKPKLAVTVPASYRIAEWITTLSPNWMSRIVHRHSKPNGD